MGDVLVWMDLETTGLDSRIDLILEVAVVLTDTDLEPLTSGNWLVRSHLERDWLVSSLPGRVLDLHRESGLLDDLTRSWTSLPGMGEVDLLVADLLATWHPGADGDLLLAGSGTDRFDRRFLEEQMPLTEKLLHYRGVDVSPSRLMAGWWNTALAAELAACVPTVPHRALPDVKAALAQARLLRAALARAG